MEDSAEEYSSDEERGRVSQTWAIDEQSSPLTQPLTEFHGQSSFLSSTLPQSNNNADKYSSKKPEFDEQDFSGDSFGEEDEEEAVPLRSVTRTPPPKKSSPEAEAEAPSTPPPDNSRQLSERPADDVDNGVDNDELLRAYDVLSELIPPYAEYTLRDYGVGAGAMFISAVVSLTTLNLAGQWAAHIEDGGFYTVVSMGCNFIANFTVNTISFIQVYNVFTYLSERWQSNRMSLNDDNLVKNSLIGIAIVSAIAAAPNVIFYFDGVKVTPTIWYERVWAMVIKPLIQWLASTSQNIRGLSIMINVDTQKPKAVVDCKRVHIQYFHSLMTPEFRDQIPEEHLELMANSQTTKPHPRTIKARKALGFFAKWSVLGYAIAFGYSFYPRAITFLGAEENVCHPAVTLDGGIISTLGITGIALIMVISFLIRFFLLGSSNEKRAHAAFSPWDESLFKVEGFEVQTSSVKNPTMRKILGVSSAVGSTLIGLGATGSGAEVPEKYFFCDRGGITLSYSITLSLFSTLGINIGDVKDFLDTAGSEGWRRLGTCSPLYNPLARFGITDNQFLFICMYRLTIMPMNETARKFLMSFDGSFKGPYIEARELGLSIGQFNRIANLKKHGIYGNYANNETCRKIDDAATSLQRANHPNLMHQWLRRRRNAGVNVDDLIQSVSTRFQSGPTETNGAHPVATSAATPPRETTPLISELTRNPSTTFEDFGDEEDRDLLVNDTATGTKKKLF